MLVSRRRKQCCSPNTQNDLVSRCASPLQCFYFFSLPVSAVLSLSVLHMQGWGVWESDDSSVAHLIVAWPYLGFPEIRIFSACVAARSRHCRDIRMSSLLLSLSFWTILPQQGPLIWGDWCVFIIKRTNMTPKSHSNISGFFLKKLLFWAMNQAETQTICSLSYILNYICIDIDSSVQYSSHNMIDQIPDHCFFNKRGWMIRGVRVLTSMSACNCPVSVKVDNCEPNIIFSWTNPSVIVCRTDVPTVDRSSARHLCSLNLFSAVLGHLGSTQHPVSRAQGQAAIMLRKITCAAQKTVVHSLWVLDL